MDRSRRRLLACAAAPLGLGGCAGFRGGWESAAYVGDSAPADLKGGRALELPGLSLQVSINNRLQTRDMQVMLYVVPTSFDPRDVYTDLGAETRTRVHLRAQPRQPGWVFRPAAARITFGGRTHGAVAGQEFGRWGRDGQRDPREGRHEHQPVTGERALADLTRRYLLSVDFEVPAPHPAARDITLDIAGCLVAPEQPPLPPIRFAPVRWEEGYT